MQLAALGLRLPLRGFEMTERLNNDFQFIEVGRKDPKKKLLRQRKKEFVEIYEPFKPQQACEQAHRCLGCGNPCLLYTSPSPRD